MITVYILQSLKDGIYYTGMAADVFKRLEEHNKGKSKFTSGHIPWKIVYTEDHDDWKSARIREKYLKSSAGKQWFKMCFTEE